MKLKEMADSASTRTLFWVAMGVAIIGLCLVVALSGQLAKL